jgi:hypothetical protein
MSHECRGKDRLREGRREEGQGARRRRREIRRGEERRRLGGRREEKEERGWKGITRRGHVIAEISDGKKGLRPVASVGRENENVSEPTRILC